MALLVPHEQVCQGMKRARQQGNVAQPGANLPLDCFSLALLSDLKPITLAQMDPGFLHEVCAVNGNKLCCSF